MSVIGNRYECSQCGIKFYDLGKSEAICPSCGTDQDDSQDDGENADDD